MKKKKKINVQSGLFCIICFDSFSRIHSNNRMYVIPFYVIIIIKDATNFRFEQLVNHEHWIQDSGLSSSPNPKISARCFSFIDLIVVCNSNKHNMLFHLFYFYLFIYSVYSISVDYILKRNLIIELPVFFFFNFH